MATVTAFLKHNHINKAQQKEPYTAMAHARYIMRQEATQHVYSERMPKQYHAVQRFLEEHENGLRKNGRVLDKFIISVPHDVSEKDAVETLRRFGNRLGMGRTPFLFSLQGFDTRNHHAHFIFIDRDVETGKRVYGTTERNSTHGIKLEWESVANQAFEEMGYDVRVKVHEGYELQAENDNQEALETPSVEASDVDDLSDIENSPEDTLTGDEDMASIEMERAEHTSLVAHNIRFLHATVYEVNRLNDCKKRLAEAQERYLRAVALKQRADVAASSHLSNKLLPAQQEVYQADAALSQLTSSKGKLKGFGISAFGLEWKTNTRKEAEAAQERSALAHSHADYQDGAQSEYNYAADTANVAMLEAIAESEARKLSLRHIYGTDEEIAKAEKSFEDTIIRLTEGLQPEHALEAFESMEITEEEYITYLKQTGNEKALAEFMENRDKYVIMEVDDDYEV